MTHMITWSVYHISYHILLYLYMIITCTRDMMTYITDNATCSLLSQDCFLPLIHGLSYECNKQTKKCVSLLSLLFCTRWLSQFLEQCPEIRTAIRITLLLCTQLKNHSTIRESFYSANGVQAFPTEKKLEAFWRARSRSIYSVVQSRDCQNSKSQNCQNFKPGIITTSKQGSSVLWSKNPWNFEARILRTSKAGSSAL